MKKLSFILSLILLLSLSVITVSAYDYYGKVMPDHLYNAESITGSVSNAAASAGMLYDTDTDRIYFGFKANTSATAPGDGAYVQANIPEEVTASDYRYIKIGYKGYIENRTESAPVDINIGIGGTRFWCERTSALPSCTFDGKHREVIIDASIFNSGDAYNGGTNPGYDGIDVGDVYTYVRLKPWGSNSTSTVEQGLDDNIRIEYIAFFKTEAEAEAYTTERYNYNTSKNPTLAADHLNYHTTLMKKAIITNKTCAYPFVRFTANSDRISSNAPEHLCFEIRRNTSAEYDIKEYKYFSFSYRSNIASSDTIDFNLGTLYGPENVSARIWGPRINYVSDGEIHTITIDLSALNYTGGDDNYYAPADGETVWGLVNDITYVRIKPYNQKMILEGEYFDLIHFGFFSSVEEAEAYVPENPEHLYFRGDVNSDYVITPADEILLARALTDPALEYSQATISLDVNGDDIINAIDHAILARHIAGWGDYSSLYTEVASDEYIDSLNDEFEARKNEILNSESEWELGEGGEIFYVSPSGSDSNSGKSAAEPWATTKNLTSTNLSAGDVVLFERGGVWREKFTSVEGVTYSAYGSGNKPAFYGSVDGANPEDWTEVATNIWQFTARTFNIASEDVGCIIFNEGEAYGARILTENGISLSVGMDGITSNGLEKWYREEREFADEYEMTHDLEYYLNPESGYVFVYSDEGNPAERFYSVELSTKVNIIRGMSNCTFDNLTIKYGSSHGIGMGSVSNVTVRNCEVGWIGGAIQNYNSSVSGRFGNGIEIYGSSDGFYVYNNYVYECFDCGVTVQRQGSIADGTTVKQIDNYFYDNVIERCNSPLESWITHPDAAKEDTFMYMSNVVFERNLCRRSGWGFGGYIHTKTDNNMFYGGGTTNAIMVNSFIKDNIMWDIRNLVILAVPTTSNYGKGFIWKNNTIIKEYNSRFARIATNLTTTDGGSCNYDYTDENLALFEQLRILGDNKYMTCNSSHTP